MAIQPDAERLICHNDLGPWNLVRNENRWVFIDWDGSGPSSILWDLAYAAQSFVPLNHGGDPEHDAVRLRAFVEAYPLTRQQRGRLSQLLPQRTQAMVQLLEDGARRGVQPWAQLYNSDQGAYWRRTAAYIARHQRVWVSALSF